MTTDLFLEKNLADVQKARTWLSDFLTTQTPAKEKNRIILAVDEALVNIIEHSLNATFIKINLHNEAGFITVTIVDNGEPFDPHSQVKPDINEHINGKSHGLGVFLYSQIMKVDYKRIADENILKLSKKIEA